MTLKIDHLVVAADTLEQGIAYIEQQFSVKVPLGGVHPLMGTHNCLMQAGDNMFFEIIAINPQSLVDDALRIKHPRWFSLDDPLLRAQLKQSPKLLTWLVNTQQFEETKKQGIYRQTAAHLLSRNNLSWHFALPLDGSLLANGILPYLLQWQGPNPAQTMPNKGCALEEITIYHPQPQWIKDQLDIIGASHLVSINALQEPQSAFFEARFQTPKGPVTLSSNTAG